MRTRRTSAHHARTAATSALVAVLFCGSAAAQGFRWTPTFAGEGAQGPGHSVSVADIAVVDGPAGDEVIFSGAFSAFDGCPANHVAQWDGSATRALGGGVTAGTSASASAEFQGELYVGGFFTEIGGVSAHGIARWNGANWSAVQGPFGEGLASPGIATSMIVHDDGSGPALFVAGWFSHAGGVGANNIAKWTGSEWQPLAIGLNKIVEDVTTWDDGAGEQLYVSGFFTLSGGISIKGVARWNGTQWSALGAGGPQTAHSIGAFQHATDGGLFVPTSTEVHRWDGASWSTTPAANVEDFATFDSGSGERLYAGSRTDLLEWNGAQWTSVASFEPDEFLGSCRTLAACDLGPNGGEVLIAGGGFVGVSSPSMTSGIAVRGVALWNGSTWSSTGAPLANGLDNNVNALEVFDDGRGDALYVGGAFERAGEIDAKRIARWDGDEWEALGAGVTGNVNALAVYDDGSGDALYATGAFNQAGGNPVGRIARWNGSQWAALGVGLTGVGQCLEVFDDGSGPELYVGGDINSAGGVTTIGIARWDGSAWSHVGVPGFAGFNDGVYALEVFDDGSGPALYAGGFFTMWNGAPMRYIARYQNGAWTEVGGGVDAAVFSLLADGSTLYVGGEFTAVGGTQLHNLARFENGAWSAVTIPWPTERVQCMTMFDEGDGPRLYVGGRFATPAWRVGRVEGQTLVPLGEGTSWHVKALASFDDGHASRPALYVGGPFDGAGPFNSPHIARWANGVAPPPESYCTAGTTSSGCQALISANGEASRCAEDGFEVAVQGVEGQKLGIVFFGRTPTATSWGSGTSFVCVAPPTTRASTQSSGGTAGSCDGAFLFDLNAWMSADPVRAPAPGETIYLQAWFRDPPSPKGTSLSDALRVEIAP